MQAPPVDGDTQPAPETEVSGAISAIDASIYVPSTDHESFFSSSEHYTTFANAFVSVTKESPPNWAAVLFSVTKAKAFDTVVFQALIEESDEPITSKDPFRVYAKCNLDQSKSLRKKMKEALSSLHFQVIHFVSKKARESMAIAGGKKPEDVEVLLPRTFAAVAKKEEGPKEPPARISWADTMDSADEIEKLTSKMDSLLQAIRQGKAAVTKDIAIPANLKGICPILYESMQRAAALTGSVLVEETTVNIVTAHSKFFNDGTLNENVSNEVKNALASIVQISRSLTEVFSVEEYKEAQSKLGLHFAAKQFIAELGDLTDDGSGKKVIDALVGDDEIIRDAMHQRISIIFTDANSPARILTAAAILLKRLAKRSLKSDRTDLKERLWSLAQEMVRQPAGVVQSCFNTQVKKLPNGEKKISLLPPQITADCVYTPAEKLALNHVNALVLTSFKSVRGFDRHEDGNPFKNYYDRVNFVLQREYKRAHAVSKDFNERKKSIRQLALQKQKALQPDTKKKGAVKDVKIDRNIYIEAYEEEKAKKSPDQIEIETLRSLKTTYVAEKKVRESIKTLADICKLTVEDINGVETVETV